MSKPQQRVQATYAGPVHFLSSDQWNQIRSRLHSQLLPLRDLEWKPASRMSNRSIPELDIDLVSWDTVREDNSGASQVPTTVLLKPLLNIYVTTCDDTEMYRTTVKKQIKDWHTVVTQRRGQEWFIVYFVRPDLRTGTNALLKIKATVLDKMRADFNADKKDRCIQLTWSSSTDNPTLWVEITSKVKEGIMAAFDAAVIQKEEEIKRSENQRQMPGWNFCTFFVLKESLAQSFEGMNLLEDASIVYDELEASFSQVLKERNLSWFGKLIEPTHHDDTQPILAIDKKPYRDMILANTISVFDFRVYLLARQCHLLARKGTIVEVCRKVATFLGAFARRLREADVDLPTYFVESWTYSGAISAVDTCDSWAKARNPEKSLTAAFNASKAVLLELGRCQLDKLGILLGYLPQSPPFYYDDSSSSMFSPINSPTTPKDRRPLSQQISNPDLLKVLTNKPAFYELYVRLTNRAIELYAKSGRRKFALKMHGSLAALDFHRQRFGAALQVYTSLPAHYSPHRWSSLESFMLFMGIESHQHKHAGSDHDREWIHTAIAFLKAYVEDKQSEILLGVADKDAYVTQLVTDLREAASKLESDVTIAEHPMLSIRLKEESIRIIGDRDGYKVDVDVINNLPCSLLIDQLTVRLVGRDSIKLTLSSDDSTSLTPGENIATLSCPMPMPGTFMVESVEAKFGHIILQWPKDVKAKRRRSSMQVLFPSTKKDTPILVSLPRDPDALDVVARQPDEVHVGPQSFLCVSLTSGRNKVVDATIRLTSPHAQFSPSECRCLKSDDNERVSFAQDVITISESEARSEVALLVPYNVLGTANPHPMKININVEYRTHKEPDLPRKLVVQRQVTVSLPIAVNAQDFFRGSKLFTKFTVSTTSHQHLRILSVDLRHPDGASASKLKIRGGKTKSQGTTVVTPSQPAKFLFQMEVLDRSALEDSLQLHITYRLLREEVEGLIKRRISALPDGTPRSELDRLQSTLVKALERDSRWVQMYEACGQLHVPHAPTEDHDNELLASVLEGLTQCTDTEFLEGKWRQAIFNTDMPNKSILVAARLYITSDPFTKEPVKPGKAPPLVAGQPVSVALTLHTSFQWDPDNDYARKDYWMRYEVEEMFDDWLISGKRRGDFLAKDNETTTIAFSLIALHHGELQLPRVHAFPLLSDDGQTSAHSAPTCEVHQVHGAERVLVSPSGGRTTFMLNFEGEG